MWGDEEVKVLKSEHAAFQENRASDVRTRRLTSNELLLSSNSLLVSRSAVSALPIKSPLCDHRRLQWTTAILAIASPSSIPGFG
jgi:hypothetical protein